MNKRNNTFDQIRERKLSHLSIAVSPEAQVGESGFSSYRFVHNALPDINFDSIDTQVCFLDKKVSLPIFISCMTGGVAKGEKINENLAKAAQKYSIPMGVGSQRIAIDHPIYSKIFNIRKFAPNIPVLANLGLVQLNYGYGLAEVQKAIQMIDADAIVFHLNPIQEAVQPEGNRNFNGLLPKLEKIVKKVKKPVIIKEVGFGLSVDVVKSLYGAGVRIFDCAGWGGTSWSFVEGKRHMGRENLGEIFSEWGIPTAKSIEQAAEFKKLHKNITILGSGGIRNGLEIAKAIALGANMAGIAAPFAKAALVSQEEVEKLIEEYKEELKVAMFGVGADTIQSLKKQKLTKINTFSRE